MNVFFGSKAKRIPKYELIEVSDMEKEDHALSGEWYKLKALRSFGDVKKGSTGGYVKRTFLSQNGCCWIEAGCKVENCKIYNNAKIKKGSEISNVSASYDAVISGSNIEPLAKGTTISLNGNAHIINCSNIVIANSLEMEGDSHIEGVSYIRIDRLKMSGDCQIGTRKE